MTPLAQEPPWRIIHARSHPNKEHHMFLIPALNLVANKLLLIMILIINNATGNQHLPLRRCNSHVFWN